MAQWRAVVDLPASVRAPAMSRRVVSVVLAGWGLQTIVEDSEQVVTELVTNALQHAPGAPSYELELLGRDGGVRIWVADGSQVLPVVRAVDPSGVRGRGLQIVSALGTEWGCDQAPAGKRVWVDLDVPPGMPAPVFDIAARRRHGAGLPT